MAEILSLTPTTVHVTHPPPGYWQSVPCPACGAGIGVPCHYPSGRVAHTRHGQRDAAVKAASAADVANAARARLEAAGYA